MISSESGEDGVSSEGTDDHMKPIFLFGNIPEFSVLASSGGPSQPVPAAVPYPYSDPYFGGLLTQYGPQAVMIGIAPTRVPLPLDIADDGPIYVNAKQYHGILRRRQSRAKQEAQNKLIKQRKPYLHESRHLHALKRVRGSGGRFLSKKQLDHPNPETVTPSPSSSTHLLPDSQTPHSGFTKYSITTTTTTTTTTTDPDVNDCRFPSGAACGGGGGGGGVALVCGRTHHCASAVR